MSESWWWPASKAVARRPDLWKPALGQLRALAPNRWWTRLPPVPVPSRAWLSFRMETAYGDPDARPDARDVVAFLEWCKETRLGRHGMR
ncbi:MAG: hypothetical protein ACLQK4_15465 [Acidimicrobiales bacterium]